MSQLAQLLDEAEAGQLPALIETWEHADDARRWIARALRIDLALAIERPDLVLPALHRRLVRFGNDAAWFTRSTPPLHAAEAAALVASWIDAWSPGRRWLRAMWPPPVALDAGVLAEYRCALRGSIRFADDRIGVVAHDECVVWERATGRRLAGATMASSQPENAWSLAEQVDGRIVLTSGSRTLEIPIGAEECPNGHDELAPEIALVRGIDGDGYAWWLVDLEHARIIHTGYSVPTASGAGRGKIYVAVRDTIHMFDRSGHLGSWSCPGVRDLAVSPEGLLATSTDGVIRVWDPVEAVAGNVQRRRDPAPASTLWSPDGTQLVSAGRLFDASTGDVIAELAVTDWSGAIEGGPAANFQRFTERGFVEAGRRLRAWDHQGLVVVDRDCRVFGSRGVSIDPTGRRYALGTSKRLEVTSLLGNDTVLRQDLELAGGREPRFAFTATGALWWELVTGERWLLPPEASTPIQTTDEPPVVLRTWLAPHDGLLVVGDAALPVDEQVVASPTRPWYASRTTLIQLVG